MFHWEKPYKLNNLKIYVQSLKTSFIFCIFSVVLTSCAIEKKTALETSVDRVVSLGSNEPWQLNYTPISADDVPEIGLGQEYTNYSKTKKQISAASKKSKHNVAEKVLLYLPSRLLDLWDILKVDVGVGPSFGAVARITKYGQVGYRTFSPASIRLGMRGRQSPIFLENENEFGIGPAFVQSSKRQVSESELGAGVDLLVLGAYLGIDLFEIADFVAGIFTVDLKGDDL